MSIETQLSEIHAWVKDLHAKMVAGQMSSTAPSSPTTSAPQPAQTAAPASAPVPPGPPLQAQAAPGAPPAPVASPPMAPGAPPQASAPATAAPGITLDQIRDKLNNWWRAHPDRSGEIMVILGECNVTKVDDLRPEHYGFVWQKLEALGG